MQTLKVSLCVWLLSTHTVGLRTTLASSYVRRVLHLVMVNGAEMFASSLKILNDVQMPAHCVLAVDHRTAWHTTFTIGLHTAQQPPPRLLRFEILAFKSNRTTVLLLGEIVETTVDHQQFTASLPPHNLIHILASYNLCFLAIEQVVSMQEPKGKPDGAAKLAAAGTLKVTNPQASD